TGQTLRQASEDLPDDHLRGALQHAPADRSDLAADGSVVDVFEAGVAVVQFYEAHPRTAGGRAHRAVAGAGQLQRVRRVEVGQANLGGEARTDHADTYGDVGAVLVLTLALQCVAAGDDRLQRFRIEQ